MATLTRTMTYAELVAAITAGTLNKGESITISDYQTTYIQPVSNESMAGEIEPIIVTAISNNELKPEAYSVAFPDDIIYYCPDNDREKVTGCTKGYIYRRIDTKQANDFPFDFRQVKFRRWQISQPTYDVTTEYGKGNVVKHESNNTLWMSLINNNIGNALAEGSNWRKFEWDNDSYPAWNPDYFPSDEVDWFLTPNSNYKDYKMFANEADYVSAKSNKIESPDYNIIEQCNNVIFGADFYNNSIGANFCSNSIGANFYSNSIGAYFYKNSVGADFYNNSIGANFRSNSIGAYFYKNSIGADFYNNSIGAYFYSNSIGSYFSSNSIGANFYYNSIGANFYYNSIGANFRYNSIGANFRSNSIGANFRSNSIGAYFYKNSIGANFNQNTIADNFNNVAGSQTGVDFAAASHVYAQYTCNLFTRIGGTPRLKYCNDSDVEVIVAANA